MKLRIRTRRHPPDVEEEHAEPQLRAVGRPAQPQVEVEAQRLVQHPVEVGPAVRLQAREVVYLLRPLTTVPLSFLQCGLKSTKAR